MLVSDRSGREPMADEGKYMSKNRGSSRSSGKSIPMTPKAASRIQAHADRTQTNTGFKARAQSAGARNTGGSGKGGKK